MSVTSSFSNDLEGLATQTVTHRVRSSRNNYGENVYAGAATTYNAYVQQATSADLELQSNDFIVEYRAYIPSTSLEIALGDEVTFADGVVRQIVRVDERFDEYGKQCVVVFLGKLRL